MAEPHAAGIGGSVTSTTNGVVTTSAQVQTQSPTAAPGPPEDSEAEQDWDGDSALGAETQSQNYSITKSVLECEYENGRTYHSFRSGIYPLPNDVMEQERTDQEHEIYRKLLDGKLCTAPIGPNIQRILDIGTGTGTWAIAMAYKYPSAEVIGTDLSVLVPEMGPHNLRIEIDDCEDQWLFSGKFDYIHICSMRGCIEDWPMLMEQANDNLHPGGWIELMDFETQVSTDDSSLRADSAWSEYQCRLNEASSKFGKVMNTAPHYKEYVSGAGFTNVTDVIYKVPYSPWPSDTRGKELGHLMQDQMSVAVESYALALLSRVLEWDYQNIQMLLARVREDLKNPNYHLYSKVHVVCGMKPFS